MFGRVRIRKHERGLWFRDGDFHRLLMPGKYRLWRHLWFGTRDRVEVISTLTTRFEHALLDVLVKEAALRDQLTIVDINDGQRAFVWKDDRLEAIYGPGRYALWNEPSALTVEVHEASAFHFEHPRSEAIVAHKDASKWLAGLDVEPYEQVVLFRDREPEKILGPGRHLYWKNVGRVTWKSIDRREQISDVSGQEIMTRDKVTLRVNMLVSYQVTDVFKAVSQVSDHVQVLYREAQLALRAAISTRTLDTLLTDKEAVTNEVTEALSRRVNTFGVVVRSVGLRDVILPGEMKTILNQVIEAEKQAQANLIRRREETAAARSQANTAKLLSENPMLARMKELEALADIMKGSKSTFIFGSGELTDQVKSLVSMNTKDDC